MEWAWQRRSRDLGFFTLPSTYFCDTTQNLQRKQTPTNSQAERYEIQQTGPENIQVQGGGEQVWADGIRPSDSKLLDAKYVKNPDNSPYVPDSNMDEDIRGIINTKTDNEFRRYGAVINDPNTPVTGLEVITNEPRAVPYFQGLMNKYNIPGDVVVKP